MIRRYWIRWWLVTVIAWPSVDPDLCHHMASLGHTELTVEVLRYFLGYRRPSIAKGTSIKLVYLCCHHCGSHGLTLGHLQVTNRGECHLSTSITDATDTWAPFQYPIRRLIVAPFQYPIRRLIIISCDSRSREIGSSNAVEVPVNFQSDRTILDATLAASRLHVILQ